MNQLSGNSVKSPLPDYKGSDPNYPVNHSHSRSQPQPMDRRSVEYPFVGPSSVPVCVQPNLAPTINHPIRPGLPNLQQTAVYQSLANSNANMISSCGSGSTTLYGSRTKPYPIQSHTYYDIRQSDQSGDVNLMHKSKSQQITLRDSKPSPHNTSMTEDEVSADQASNDFAVINPTSIGTAQINDSIFKNRSNEACWRELASDTRSKEWNMPSEQPNINVSESLPRFMLSPVDSPKYIAAAYKEASFVWKSSAEIQSQPASVILPSLIAGMIFTGNTFSFHEINQSVHFSVIPSGMVVILKGISCCPHFIQMSPENGINLGKSGVHVCVHVHVHVWGN